MFVTGDASLINSTHEAGFFPMVFAILLPIGLYGVVRSRQPVPLAMAIGFLSAPLVSMISGAIEMNRVMFAIPFGVLVAAYGVHVMLRARPVAIRAAAVLLLLAIGWQFAGFYSGYFGGYGRSAAPWLAGNVREALRALMAQADTNRRPDLHQPGDRLGASHVAVLRDHRPPDGPARSDVVLPGNTASRRGRGSDADLPRLVRALSDLEAKRMDGNGDRGVARRLARLYSIDSSGAGCGRPTMSSRISSMP